jgi:hypothetical protein
VRLTPRGARDEDMLTGQVKERRGGYGGCRFHRLHRGLEENVGFLRCVQRAMLNYADRDIAPRNEACVDKWNWTRLELDRTGHG